MIAICDRDNRANVSPEETSSMASDNTCQADENTIYDEATLLDVYFTSTHAIYQTLYRSHCILLGVPAPLTISKISLLGSWAVRQAGTDKSTVIDALLNFAHKWGRTGSFETLAFTGVAAINISGRTIPSVRKLKSNGAEPNAAPSLEMQARFDRVILVIIGAISISELLGGTDIVSRLMAPTRDKYISRKRTLVIGDYCLQDRHLRNRRRLRISRKGTDRSCIEQIPLKMGCSTRGGGATPFAESYSAKDSNIAARIPYRECTGCLDPVEKKWIIASLTVWDAKPKQGTFGKSNFDFRPGGMYTFRYVDDVGFYTDIAKGGMKQLKLDAFLVRGGDENGWLSAEQHRLARLQAVPLSTPVLVVDDTDNRARGEVIQSDPDAHMTLERKPEISTSATQISAKHKNRMGSLQDEVEDPILGSPTRGRERMLEGAAAGQGI
ncbi:hypothetical protein GQ600_4614 [Phytophthora cactorum]|nr:hypothetical protein GQ600_4614 [Phytophthora cactorum]